MARLKLDHAVVNLLHAQNDLARDLGFYLAGGSAAALHFNHRSSRDLDWFTPDDIDTDADALSSRLQNEPTPPDDIDVPSANTVYAYYGNGEQQIHASFITAKEGDTETVEKHVGKDTVRLASVQRLATMKAGAVFGRVEKNTFMISMKSPAKNGGVFLGLFIMVMSNSASHRGCSLARW